MIQRINLERFGLYRDRSFELAPVTIFVGPNESGKTTVFHALLDSLCRPHGTTAQARSLQSRYGKQRKSSVEPAEYNGAIAVEEFTELLAIDSGAVTLNISENADWMQAVKARLFSGGIDPSALATELQKESSDKKTYAHMKRLKELQTQLEELEQNRDRLAARRSDILRQEHDLQERTRELESTERRLDELRGEHARIERYLAGQSGASERERARGLLAKIEALEQLERELEHRKAFGDPRAEELSRLERALEAARERLSRSTTTREHAEQERETALRAHREAERGAAAAGRLGEAAKSLRRSLEQNRVEPVARTSRRPRPLVLAAAAGLLAAAAAPAVLFGVPEGVVAAAAVAALAVVLAVTLGFSRSLEYDYAPVENAVKRARDEWQRETGEALAAESYEGVISALSAIESRTSAAQDELERRRLELEDHDRKQREAQAAERSAQDETAQAERSLRAFLEAFGVGSVGEYHNARAEYEAKKRRRDELVEELKQTAERYGATGRAALRAELNRVLEQASEHDATPDEHEKIKRAETRRARLAQEIENLQSSRDRLAAEVAELRGNVRGSLGDIPEQLLALETRIADLERESTSLNHRREAAGVAAEIFAEIAAESDHVLEDLAREITAQLSSITGDRRELSFARLALDGAQLADASGTARTPQQLSQGTRDAFMLAARLALALKARDGDGILVFDEPFESLDEERTEGALRLLQHLQYEHGTQLVFFTKDEDLLERCAAVFEDAQVHRLRRVQRSAVERRTERPTE